MPRLSIVLNAVAIAATLTTLGCATASTSGAPTPVNDPRIGLKAGRTDAAQALGNLRMTGHAESPPHLAQQMNSDLAFTGNYAVQGNFNGIAIWDMANPSRPTLVTTVDCPASQNDVSVYRNLLFVSVESNTS